MTDFSIQQRSRVERILDICSRRETVRREIEGAAEMVRWEVERKAEIKARGFGRTESDVKWPAISDKWISDEKHPHQCVQELPCLLLVSDSNPIVLPRPKDTENDGMRRSLIRLTADWPVTDFSRLLPLLPPPPPWPRKVLETPDPRSGRGEEGLIGWISSLELPVARHVLLLDYAPILLL